MVKGTGGLVQLMRQYYSRLVVGPGNTPKPSNASTLGDTVEDIFFDCDVPALTEHLARWSSKWEEIALSLWLPSNKIDNIRAKKCKPAMALEEVLSSWVACEFGAAKPPTLNKLEYALRSELVGLGAEANNLKTQLCVPSFQSSKEKDTDLHLNIEDAVIEITGVTDDVYIVEGKSVLLEVQISPKHFDGRYEWCMENDYGSIEPIGQMREYQGCDESILYLSVKDLSFEGTYLCKVHGQITLFPRYPFANRPLLSDRIKLAVSTPLDEHQNVLVDRYTVLPAIPRDTWPPVSIGTFINLALIKQESIHVAGEYGRLTIRGDMDDILKNKKSITYREVTDGLSGGGCLLIEGRPGSGKTTFVHKLTLDWARVNNIIKRVRLLFLIHLRGFSSNPNVGLQELVGCYYDGHPGMKDILAYARKHNGLGLCFILDGLDEYLPSEKNGFIFELIRKDVLPQSVVIVASRPAAASDFRSVATRQVEVLGFLSPEIRKYIGNYPFSVDSKCQGLNEYLDQHPNVFHMCYLPIHASMVCFLYDNIGARLPETETEIYEKFTTFAMLRTLYRSHGKSRVSIASFNDLSPFQRDHYFKICKLAFEMTLSSKQVMKHAEVKHIFTSLEEKELFGLITVDNMATLCGFEELYTFLHLTFQEFLAACYISGLGDEEQMELIKQHGSATQMKQVWKFYCGLVKLDDSAGIKFNALVNQAQYGTLFHIQCSFESQRSSTCESVVKNSCLHFKDCYITTSDFSAMAFVISNTQQQCVSKIVLDKCIYGSDGVIALAKRSNARLHLVTTLCVHGHDCTGEELSLVNKLMHSLPCLTVLDLTNTNLGGVSLSALTNDLDHPNLEVLKISGYPRRFLPSSLCDVDVAFRSKCKKFAAICVSGSDISKTNSLFPSLNCNMKHIDMSFRTLRLLECEVLSADLIVNPHVTTRLSLIACGIDNYATSCLAEGMKHCTALEILELCFNSISDDGAICLADSSIYNHKLCTINLSCNQIGDKGAMAIAITVKSIEGFKLYLWNNNISRFEDILSIFPETDLCSFEFVNNNRKGNSNHLSLILTEIGESFCKDLSVLNLIGWTLSHEDVKILAKMLKFCGKLQSFSYGSFTIRSFYNTSSVIIEALKYCKDLHTLTLKSLVLGARGAEVLAHLLQQYSLKNLDISHSELGEDGAQALTKALICSVTTANFCAAATPRALNSTQCVEIDLISLNVSYNNILSGGCKALSQVLAHCTNLATLNISSNAIESSGACALAHNLILCTNLRALDVGFNDIGDIGMEALMSQLKSSTKLEELTVTSNNIGANGALCLAKVVGCWKELRKLNVAFNPVTHDGSETLARSLMQCTKLRLLCIDHYQPLKISTPVQQPLASSPLTPLVTTGSVPNKLPLVRVKNRLLHHPRMSVVPPLVNSANSQLPLISSPSPPIPPSAPDAMEDLIECNPLLRVEGYFL